MWNIKSCAPGFSNICSVIYPSPSILPSFLPSSIFPFPPIASVCPTTPLQSPILHPYSLVTVLVSVVTPAYILRFKDSEWKSSSKRKYGAFNFLVFVFLLLSVIFSGSVHCPANFIFLYNWIESYVWTTLSFAIDQLMTFTLFPFPKYCDWNDSWRDWTSIWGADAKAFGFLLTCLLSERNAKAKPLVISQRYVKLCRPVSNVPKWLYHFILPPIIVHMSPSYPLFSQTWLYYFIVVLI